MKKQHQLLITALAASLTVQVHAGEVILTPIGHTPATTTDNYISIGENTAASGNGVSMGLNASSQRGIAIGHNTKIDTTAATHGDSGNVVAIGRSATVEWQGGTAVGANTYTTQLDSTAVGVLSEAHSLRSTALGTYATVLSDARDSTAIGARSSVSAEDVKDGVSKFTGETIAKSDGVLSVGQSAATATVLHNAAATGGVLHNGSHAYSDAVNRRIINVAGGMEDYDAANIKQLSHVHNTLDGKITTLNNTVTTTNTTVANLNTNVTNLGNRVTTTEGNVTTLTNRVNTAETNLTNLTTRVATNEGNITGLTTRMGTAESNITALQNRVTTTETNVSNLTTRVSTNETNITGLDTRVTALENGLGAGGALSQRLDAVETRANAGAALALATANMATPPAGKSALMLGTGFYRDSNAVAVGVAHTAESWGVKAAVSAAGRRNFGGGVGASLFW